MPELSLCMIAQNEAKVIGRCLESVRGIVDEIIVVDTGSTDETAVIAKQFGAQVYDFPWNDDFSAARNHSLEFATGDWILILDADEALSKASRALLREALREDTYEGYFCKLINYVRIANQVESMPGLVFRMMRNRPQYRFHGSIHEQIIDTIAATHPNSQMAVREDFVILHYGYQDNPAAFTEKRLKYQVLLRNELQKNPENRLLRAQYGEELFHAGRYHEAIAELAQAGDGLDPQVHFMPKLLRTIILSYMALKQADAALTMVQKSITLLPAYADLHYLGGVIYLEKQQIDKAEEFFHRALRLPEAPSYYASTAGVRGFRSLFELGKISELRFHPEAALEYYTRSFQDNPDLSAALEKVILLQNPYRDPIRVKTYLENMADFQTPAASLGLGRLLYVHSVYRLALEYLENGSASPEAPPDIEIWKADCLFQQGRCDAAYTILERYTEESPLYLMATFHLLVCAWLRQDHPKLESTGAILLQKPLAPDTKTIIAWMQSLPGVQTVVESEGEFAGNQLGPEGLTLFCRMLLRALDLKAFALADAWIRKLGPEQRTANAAYIKTLFQNFGYDYNYL